MAVFTRFAPFARPAMTLSLIVLLPACSVLDAGRNVLAGRSGRATFDGMYFPARLTADKENAAMFSVEVSKVSQGIDPAKEAGRYEAVKYCLKNFGWSGVEWQIGPETPNAQVPISDGKLTLTGECKGWV